MYRQNQEEGTNHSLYNWEHSDFIDAHRRFLDLQYYEEVLTTEGELSKYQAELAVFYCIWFHYRNYRNEIGEYTEKELEILEEYCTYADRILYERLLFTEEEAKTLYNEALENGYIRIKVCSEYAEEIKERFK